MVDRAPLGRSRDGLSRHAGRRLGHAVGHVPLPPRRRSRRSFCSRAFTTGSSLGLARFENRPPDPRRPRSRRPRLRGLARLPHVSEDERRRERAGPRRSGADRDRRPRRADDPGAVDPRRDLRSRLRPRAGSALADGVRAAGGLGPARGDPRGGAPSHRPVPPHDRVSPRRGAHRIPAVGRSAAPSRGLRRRRERVSRGGLGAAHRVPPARA